MHDPDSRSKGIAEVCLNVLVSAGLFDGRGLVFVFKSVGLKLFNDSLTDRDQQSYSTATRR